MLNWNPGSFLQVISPQCACKFIRLHILFLFLVDDEKKLLFLLLLPSPSAEGPYKGLASYLHFKPFS